MNCYELHSAEFKFVYYRVQTLSVQGGSINDLHPMLKNTKSTPIIIYLLFLSILRENLIKPN